LRLEKVRLENVILGNIPQYAPDLLRDREGYFLDEAAFAAPASLAKISSSRRIRYSSSSILISVPLYFPNRMRSPAFTSSGMRAPFSILPAPTAITSPS